MTFYFTQNIFYHILSTVPKIDTCKSTINFYDEKSRRAAWYLYDAVIKGDEDQATYIANDIAEFENKIAEAKKELANSEPTTEETAAEDNVEVEAEDTEVKAEVKAETNIEKYLAAKEEVSFKYNKVGAKIWYHARVIIGTGAFNYGKFAGWSVDHDVRINRHEAALYLKKYGLTVEQFVAAEKEFYATRYPKDETTAEDNVEVEENTANAEAEQSTAQVEETEEKFIYTTNRGNTREVKVGETGSTVRGRWYYYHEIGGMSEQDVIELATKKESGEFVNALCKFIVNDTDGSEEDDDESFSANVMPAETDDTDNELIDAAEDNVADKCTDSGRVQATGGVSSTANDILHDPAKIVSTRLERKKSLEVLLWRKSHTF